MSEIYLKQVWNLCGPEVAGRNAEEINEEGVTGGGIVFLVVWGLQL